jgi:chemotaxis protein CheD
MKFQDGAADIFLAPGELVVCRDAVRIRTILGSCIAVCLWDRRRRVGGVNHYLLPRPTDGKTCDNRFGSVAIPRLIAGVCRAGGAPVDLEAAVIGGGRPMAGITIGAAGEANTAVALELLGERGIPVVRQETGGDHGRGLLFNPHTGELTVRRVRGWAELAVEGRLR